MDILNASQKTIEKYQLLRPGDHVLAAVSGGPDSMALLQVLLSLRAEWGIHISVAHVNHHLRTGSQADEHFVKHYCDTSAIPCFTAAVTLQRRQGQSSLEERAREARFQALTRIAKAQRIRIIALGHHRDDLAETVLMRFIRGTGLMGLRGILPLRDEGGVCLIRPLLEVRHQDILTYLHRHRIPFRRDPTNSNRRFFRNLIRLDLIPCLEKKYQPRIVETLCALAQNTTHDYDYLRRQTEKFLRGSLRRKRQKQVSLSIESLTRQHPAIQRLALRLAIEAVRGDLRRLTSRHLDDICTLIRDRTDLAMIHMPRGCTIQKKSDSLIISQASRKKK